MDLEIIIGILSAIATIFVVTKMNRYVVQSETKAIVGRLDKHWEMLEEHSKIFKKMVPIVRGYTSDKALYCTIEETIEDTSCYIPDSFEKNGRAYLEYCERLVQKFSASILTKGFSNVDNDKLDLRLTKLHNKLIEGSRSCFGERLTAKMFNKNDYLIHRYKKELHIILRDNVNSKDKQFRIETISFMQKLCKSFAQYLIAWDNRRDK